MTAAHRRNLVAPTLSLEHVGLSLTPANLEATIRWYTSKLDFVVERRFETHGISFPFIAHQEIRIELVGAASHACSAPVSDIARSHDSERLHHFCLAVEDLEATLAELGERDVHPINEPMDVAEIGQRVAFITDNCGNIIEFTEPGYHPAESRS
jgi:catechol 2,3-dioxygenase-like lactoylglutathione lyase family enzyme